MTNTMWRHKRDGIVYDTWESVWRSITNRSPHGTTMVDGSTANLVTMLARILPHLPLAAQQAALGDGWEVVETLGEKLGRLDPITRGMVDWDEVRRVQQRLDAPQTAPVAQEAPDKGVGGWQPIETAPRDGTWVLVWDSRIGGRPYITTGASPHLTATHWQPLPEPPSPGATP